MALQDTKQTEAKTPTILVIGIGNDYRRDDAAGLLVARELSKHVPAQVHVLECTGASLKLIEMWAGAGLVILVDAACLRGEPGTIYRFEVGTQSLPTSIFPYSTHGFNVPDTIELARTLGKLPPHLVVYGVECIDFGEGKGVTKEVAVAVETLTSELLDFIWSRITENAH